MHDGLAMSISDGRDCYSRLVAGLLDEHVSKLGIEDIVVEVKEAQCAFELIVELFRLENGDGDDDVWFDGFLNRAL